jgi:hypothetical protein
VKPADRRPTAAGDDRRRRYFAITPLGRQVAAIEARRMETQVDAARDRALLTEGRP